ncbi:hypothetical protein [Streptomyces albipurpureus]|uniref:Uncharacterized protein n=1 Tax=Streptomyces albipurpureus TaxID=2897419 RepID=A0ABT0UI39_9ACTN|nr:hypothetical protein [Streptomyces sp. CWNU-1]MCM2388327.1 hypothetical protein [Streptomyces sp. CWNU-1]
MEFAAEHGVTVVLSSHLVSDPERVCDHLISLVASRVQVAGDVDELLATHFRLTTARRDAASLPQGMRVIQATDTERQSTFIVRADQAVHDVSWVLEPLNLEDMVLARSRSWCPSRSARTTWRRTAPMSHSVPLP